MHKRSTQHCRYSIWQQYSWEPVHLSPALLPSEWCVCLQRVECLSTCKRSERGTRVGLGTRTRHVSRGRVLTAGDQEGRPRGRQHGHGVVLRESSDGAAGLAQTAARALARARALQRKWRKGASPTHTHTATKTGGSNFRSCDKKSTFHVKSPLLY